MTETIKKRSNFIEPENTTGVIQIVDGHIVGISLVEDERGATGFIQLDTQELTTSHADLQNYAHEFDRRIYTEQECKCGRDEFDPIHGNRPDHPSPDTDHSFDRREYSPLCKCGKPLWEAVHDVYKFEEDQNND